MTNLWTRRRNFYTPATFQSALESAFTVSDAPTAVWLWGTIALPWLSAQQHPFGLPPEYSEAIRAAKKAVPRPAAT